MLLKTLTRATLNFRKYFIGLQQNMLLQKRKFWGVIKPFSSTKCLEKKYTEEAYYEIFTEKPLLWKTSFLTKKNKKQRNKCVFLWKKCIEEYFQKVTKNGIVLKKTFGILSSLFLLNKSSSSQNDIVLIANCKVDFEGNALGRTFNHFVKNVSNRVI